MIFIFLACTLFLSLLPLLCLSYFFILNTHTHTHTHTPANEGLDVLSGDRGHTHGHGLRRGQPEGVVVPRGKVTDVVDVAEEERHGAELPQATPSSTCGGQHRDLSHQEEA